MLLEATTEGYTLEHRAVRYDLDHVIKDLGRPARFYNMMRVFKVTSPMSVGTWILSAEGTSTGIAAACELFGVLPRVRAAAQSVSGLLGPAMASYTGALVADSVVPAWHEGRHELPAVFAGSAAASAGGVAAAGGAWRGGSERLDLKRSFAGRWASGHPERSEGSDGYHRPDPSLRSG